MTDQGDPTTEHPRADAGGANGSIGARGRAWIGEHRTASLITAGALVLVLFGGGSLAAGAATGRHATNAPVAGATSTATSTPGASLSPSATPTPTPTPTPTRDVPPAIAAPAPLRTCSVAGASSAAALASFEGTVIDATTGATLFDRNGSTPARTASVMKTLTSAVALAVLGPDYRLSTTVQGDPDSGTIALVGGGDATLSAGGATVYTGAPTLGALATQVKTALGDNAVTTIDLDATYWNIADRWDPSVNRSEQTIGYQPEVVPLMVDGDRANPALATSPRSTDPVGRAGTAFKAALVAAGVNGAATATVTSAAATSSNVLGKVQSQPVSTLIGQMIPNSDNTLAEMLARVSSRVAGSDGSAASLTSVYQNALSKTYGLNASTIVIKDGSGESPNNGVPATLEAQLMVQVLNRAHDLGILSDVLPISGRTGTLATRFTGANAVARGAVHAKTGWIDTAYTLGGYMTARDGTKLTFAFYAIGRVSSATIPSIDTLTTAVFNCGANLSNN